MQQGVGQIKLRAGARLQLLHAFLLAFNGHRIGVAGPRLDTGDVTLFDGVGVFPQCQDRQLAGVELNGGAFIASFVDHGGQRLVIFIGQRLNIKHHLVKVFGRPLIGLPGF